MILKTLLISDLDGTLLTGKECISEYSLEHLNKMIDGGLLFTYATARSLNSAAKACWGLRQILPVILYNGAVVMEPWSRKMLYNNHFNREQRAFLRGLIDGAGLFPLVYSFSKEGKERVSWIVQIQYVLKSWQCLSGKWHRLDSTILDEPKREKI